MSRIETAFAIVAAAAMLITAQAQLTSVGDRFEGFTFVSNVVGYINMTADYCDIQVY